jgi:allantoinase
MSAVFVSSHGVSEVATADMAVRRPTRLLTVSGRMKTGRQTMPDYDLILRGGNVVAPDCVRVADVAVAGETIVALGPQLGGTAHEEIDGTGQHVFPGVIDAHVHFNEPGRTDWEGIETGSRALAAGGGTMFFDMPLNAHPPTLDAESFALKRAAAENSSLTDFALWGGLVPQNVDRLEDLAECGVIGFKAFMSNSGIEDFSRADDTTLREGMKRAAKLKLPVAVHAESETMTSALAQEKMRAGNISIRDYLDSRPIAAELEAIRRAIYYAGETGCALHVVHVSSSAGIQLITEAKQRGVNVSAETCPHYLTLTEDDMEKLGAVAKCAPPLRSIDEQEKLWTRVLAGEVDTIGSDHSPSPPGMKVDANFFKVWGGISGVQHTLPLLLTGAHVRRGMALPFISDLLSQNVATRFALPDTKGRIEIGCEADFALVDLSGEFTVRLEELFYRHQQAPYVGLKLRGRVMRTLLRGRTIFHEGRIVATPAGRLIKPRR